MSDSGTGRAPLDRRRSVWWLVAAGLAVVVGLIVRSFVGTLVFGLFVYYAVRPIYRRLLTHAESRVMATTTTMVVAAVPLLLVVVYGAGLAVQELLAAFGTETTGVVLSRFVENSASFTRLVQNPTAVLADFDRITQIQENLAPVLGTVDVVPVSSSGSHCHLRWCSSSYRTATESSSGSGRRSQTRTRQPTYSSEAWTPIWRRCTSGTS
jgi:predicted PurR-regulated permease PerM